MSKIKRDKYKHISTISQVLIWLTVILITWIMTGWADRNPQAVEQLFTNGLFPVIAKGLNQLNYFFAFSVDDAFYGILILTALGLILAALFRKISWSKMFSNLIKLVAIVYGAFYLLWGFNYFRQEANVRLEMQEASPDSTELLAALNWLVEETNASYTPIYTIDKKEILSSVIESYKTNSEFLKINTALLKIRPKNITMGSLFSAATIGGYYGPFFREVHVNPNLLPIEYPTVLAHEIAHALGITSEAEANFYAWYVCAHTSDQRLNYCAHFYLIRYVMHQAHRFNAYRDIIRKLRSEVRIDFYKRSHHWRALQDKEVEVVASKVNDAYLKSNKVKGGIDNYDGVVKLFMDYRKTIEVE